MSNVECNTIEVGKRCVQVRALMLVLLGMTALVSCERYDDPTVKKKVTPSPLCAADMIDGRADYLEAIEVSLERIIVGQLGDGQLSLNDHGHVLLALGTNIRLPAIYQANEHEPTTYIEWLLGRASRDGSFGRPSWLIRTPDGWAIQRLARADAWSDGEAHLGQLLCYLTDANLIDRHQAIIVPDGSVIDIQSVADGYVNRLAPQDSLEYLIPVLIRLSSKSVWTSRFGERIELNALVRQLLDTNPASAACFGGHWYLALHVLADDSSADRVQSTLRNEARDRLRVDGGRLLDCIPQSGAIDMRQWGSQRPAGRFLDPQFTFQVHSLIWLLASADDQRINDPRVELALRWACDYYMAHAGNIPLLDICHLRQLLRCYRSRIQEAQHMKPSDSHRVPMS
ncbi:MAG: hypothetical protein U0575_13940 [Phycisphaerales bacterium]